jgi:polysaccharide deacetylase 2 family uncharacterized protein YibQ
MRHSRQTLIRPWSTRSNCQCAGSPAHFSFLPFDGQWLPRVSSDLKLVLKPKPRKTSVFASPAFSGGWLVLACAIIALFSASVATSLAPGNLGVASTEQSIDPAVLASTKIGGDNQAPPDSTVSSGEHYAPLSGASGANIRRTQFAEGGEAAIISPKDRGSTGAVLLNGQRFGQDPMSAARPNEELVEQSEYGPLPKVGTDGLRPLEQYARPWSGARGTRIAIVVGGIGLSQTGSQKAVATLPSEVTLGFAASGNSLQRWMQEARRDGHEVLLQMPMEAFGDKGSISGEGSLRAKGSTEDNLDVLRGSMGKITNYAGVMNHLGGQFLANEAAVSPILEEIAGRGLLFLDDGSSAQSRAGAVAKANNYPVAFGDVTLDAEVSEAAILARLDDLERIARRNGSAIGVASAFDETIKAVSQWVNEAQRRGIEVVGVASLVSDRQ